MGTEIALEQKKRQKEQLKLAVKNIHQSLKWLWQLMMVLSLLLATSTIYSNIFSQSSAILPFFFFILGYLPVFIRFYFGINQYLDTQYLQPSQATSFEDYLLEIKLKLSKTRRLLDILLLLSHSIVFVFWAHSIATIPVFIIFYVVLLVLNITFLYLFKVTADRRNKNFSTTDPAPAFWIKNNLIHLFILTFVVLIADWLGATNSLWYALVCLTLLASNSAFDLRHTRFYYFPNLAKKYLK